MAIIDGQRVNAVNSNAAWMSRSVDTDTVGKVDLKNSGSANIIDLQQVVNDNIADIAVHETRLDNHDTAITQAQADILSNTAAINNHIGDTVDAHDASAISNVPSGNITSTDLQSTVNELQSDIDTRALSSVVNPHIAASSGVHGVTGSVVGTSDAQTLTFKKYDGGTASNTVKTVLSKNSFVALDALVKEEGSVYYDQTNAAVVYDDGSTLKAVGSGSTGAGFTHDAYTLFNAGFIATVASNELTISLKQRDGLTNPTAQNPVTVAYKVQSGYSLEEGTSSISITVPSGATLGHQSGIIQYIYVYLLSGGSGRRLGVCSTQLDEFTGYTSVVLSSGSDSHDVLYSDVAGVQSIRLIGRIQSNQATAGTWAATPDSILVGGYDAFKRIEPQDVPNLCVNGNCDFAQRSTSVTNTGSAGAGVYEARVWDRFWTYSGGDLGGYIHSQAALSSADIYAVKTGAKYAFRWNQTAGAIANTSRYLGTTLYNATDFSNKVLNISFYAKMVTGSTGINVYCETQDVTGGFSSTLISAFTLTTAMKRYTAQFTVPDLSGATFGANNRLRVYFSLPAGDVTFDFYATSIDIFTTNKGQLVDFNSRNFRLSGLTLTGEFNNCRETLLQYDAGATPFLGYTRVANSMDFNVAFPVRMRATPVFSTNTNSITYLYGGSGTFTPSGYFIVRDAASLTGAVAGTTKDQSNNICYISGSSYLRFDSETI
jgi:hypothetical protein